MDTPSLSELLKKIGQQAIAESKKLDPNFAAQCAESDAERTRRAREEAEREKADRERAQKIQSQEHEALRTVAGFHRNSTLGKTASEQLSALQEQASVEQQERHPEAWAAALNMFRDGRTTSLEIEHQIEMDFLGLSAFERRRLVAQAGLYWKQFLALAFENAVVMIEDHGWTERQIAQRLSEDNASGIRMHSFDASRLAAKAAAEVQRKRAERGES